MLLPAACDTGISYDLTWKSGEAVPVDLITFTLDPFSIQVENPDP